MQNIVLLGCMFFLSACGDCVQNVSGSVVDATNGLPLEGVKVFKKQKTHDKYVTDSTGHFKLSSISGGFFTCPPMEIVVEHPGYKKLETSIPTGGEKMIQLKKE